MRELGEHKGKKLSIVALSQDEMEATERGDFKKHIVISILSPSSDEDAKIKSDPKAILRLRFYDFDRPVEGYEDVYEHKEAKRVRNFVEDYVGKVDTIVVHCEAGVSRSVGMAAALSKVFLENDTTFFTRGRPNMRVYRKTLDAFLGEQGGCGQEALSSDCKSDSPGHLERYQHPPPHKIRFT